MRSALLLVSSAIAANAYIVNFFESNAKCIGVGAVCKTNNGVVGPCCKNAYCPEPIVDISRCTLNTVDVESGDEDNDLMVKKCLRPGALCAGIAGPTGKCCKGSKCVYESPDNAICKKTSSIHIDIEVEDSMVKCLAAGSTCSGIAGPTGTCCSGLRCVNESPDRGVCRGPKKMDEIFEQDYSDGKCLKAGATCSGIAGPTGKCCSGLRCVNESPDLSVCRGPKKSGLFVQPEAIFASEKCLKAGANCAGIAGPTGTCCSPLKCVYDSPDNATCRGIKKMEEEDEQADTDATCIKNGATCASENGRFSSCCDGWECVRDNPWNPEHGACYKKKN